MSKGKKMVCHTYVGGDYVGFRAYDSISELSRDLRENGAHFRTCRVQNLGEGSERIDSGSTVYEIEEGV